MAHSPSPHIRFEILFAQSVEPFRLGRSQKNKTPFGHRMPPRKNKEKKVDREALGSHFMRIPGMDTETARDLIDLGFSHVYELAGRAPDALYDELKKKRPNIPERKLHLLRLAVYYSEEPEPEPSKLRPEAWVS